MTSSDVRRPNLSRRFFWFAVAILVAIGVYTAGWFYAASLLEARAASAIEELSRDGAVARCDKAQARGYPFRIGLFCDEIAFDHRVRDFVFTGSRLRTAAQVYDPFRIVGEVDESRLDFLLPGAGGYGLMARDIRFSARLDRPVPQRASVIAHQLSVDSEPDNAALSVVFGAEESRVHMRRSEGDLDLAASAEKISLTPPGLGRRVELLHFDADLTMADGVRYIEERRQGLRGTSFTIRTATLETGPDAGFSASGPVSVDENGMIDGQIQITFRNPEGLAAFLVQSFPEARGQIENAAKGLAFLGDQPTLPLTIRRGQARLGGLIPLGSLPALR